ncbi:MAG: hypothetical protein K2W95_32370 [Candidatus Obscuribacterales bacterium]|nr:hypothetical protein [Candidatus Obscuribacterales bacterium]
MAKSNLPVSVRLVLYFVLLFLDHLRFFFLYGGLGVGLGLLFSMGISALAGGEPFVAAKFGVGIPLGIYLIAAFVRTCIVYANTYWHVLPVDGGKRDGEQN